MEHYSLVVERKRKKTVIPLKDPFDDKIKTKVNLEDIDILLCSFKDKKAFAEAAYENKCIPSPKIDHIYIEDHSKGKVKYKPAVFNDKDLQSFALYIRKKRRYAQENKLNSEDKEKCKRLEYSPLLNSIIKIFKSTVVEEYESFQSPDLEVYENIYSYINRGLFHAVNSYGQNINLREYAILKLDSKRGFITGEEDLRISELEKEISGSFRNYNTVRDFLAVLPSYRIDSYKREQLWNRELLAELAQEKQMRYTYQPDVIETEYSDFEPQSESMTHRKL